MYSSPPRRCPDKNHAFVTLIAFVRIRVRFLLIEISYWDFMNLSIIRKLLKIQHKLLNIQNYRWLLSYEKLIPTYRV